MLTDKAIEEFRRIYREELHTELSFGEARVLASQFMNLMRIIYRPLPDNPHDPTPRSQG